MDHHRFYFFLYLFIDFVYQNAKVQSATFLWQSYNSWSGLPGLWALGSGLLGSGLPGLWALGKTSWAPEFTGLQRLLGSLGSQTGICSQSLKCFLHCANFSSSEYVPKM